MIKGLAITPPILGRISIGKIVEKNGKRILKKMTSSRLLARYKGKTDGLNTRWMKLYGQKPAITSFEAFQSE